MSRIITVDGTDVTALTRVDGWALQMKANAGEVAAGSIVFDDTTGTADPAAAMKEWVVTESLASPTTIAGGFIADRHPDRGPLRAGVQRQWTPVLEDYNAAFMDRVLKGTNARRPVETDVERITWLASTGALGMLDDFDVDTSDPEDMEKTSYKGKYPFDVLNDCAENTGKNFYVYYKAGTGWTGFYGPWNQTGAAFTSDVRISDVNADVDMSVTFPGEAIEYELDPGRIYAALYIKWRRGWVTVTDDDTITGFRNRQKTVVRENFRSVTRARTWGEKQLAKLNEEVKRLTFTVQVPASALGEVRAGQRILVKQAHLGITDFTYFRITEATYRWATDNSYFADLVMRDKIRPVNIGDIYADPESTIGSSGSGRSGVGNEGENETGDPIADLTEYFLDDYDRTPPVVAAATSETTGTTHAIDLPTGSAVAGRLLLIFTTWTGTADSIATQLRDDHGFLQLGGLTGEVTFGTDRAAIVGKLIDGTEGWSNTGQTIEVTTLASQTVHAYAVLLESVESIADIPTVLGNQQLSANPGAVLLDSNGWGGDEAVVYTFGVSDTSISGDPIGYANVASGDGGGLFWRISLKPIFVVSSDQDPSTYTAAGDVVAFTLGVRSLDGIFGIGSLPIPADGAWWPGSNLYEAEAIDLDSWGIASALLYAESSTAGGQLVLRLHAADGELPMEIDAWELLLRYRLTTAAVPTDPGFRGLTLEWNDNSDMNLYFGDLSHAEGIEVSGDTADYLAKSLGVGQWNLVRWHYDAAGLLLARVWPEADTEPTTWDVESEVYSGVANLDFDMFINIGNDGGTAQLFELDWIKVRAIGQSGQRIESFLFAYGDGSTVTFTLPQAYQQGTLVVTVDGIVTTPASYDADAPSVTFDAAPDVDAVIRASWTAA